MATTTRTVVAAFVDNTQVEDAIRDLQRAGIRPDQIRYSVRRSGTDLTGSLEDMGLPEEEASFYNREFEAGRTVVTVMTDDRQSEAHDIMQRNGGYDSNSQAAQTGRSDASSTEDEQHLRLREEELQARKQPVESGEARLRKDVVSEQKNIDVPVSHEEVYLERRPGSGEPVDEPIGQEGETYRLPVREEQVKVEKQPVVREEVSIGKRSVQENQPVSDTLRREEAHVEHKGDVNIQGTDQNPDSQP